MLSEMEFDFIPRAVNEHQVVNELFQSPTIQEDYNPIDDSVLVMLASPPRKQ